MGESTDALLFYGYCWTEEAPQPWESEDNDDEDDEDDWEDRYARARGLAEENMSDYAAYLRRRQKLTRASGCTVGSHCSRECPMPYVAAVASMVVSHRGHPNKIKPLVVDPAWDGQLTAFCKTLGIQTNGLRPAWWLVSNWGS